MSVLQMNSNPPAVPPPPSAPDASPPERTNKRTTGEFTSTELWIHFVHHTLTRTCSSLRKRLPAPHTFKICCSFNQIGVGDHHDAVTTQRRTRGAVEVTCLLSDTSVSSGCSLVQAVVSSGCSLRCCCCF